MRKECEYCLEPFSSGRANRKYCSDNCKQMAYYKRNGLVLANFSSSNSQRSMERDRGATKNVKYESSVKRDSAIISDAMLNAIADRLLILLEQRIAQRIKDKTDTESVKPYFAETDITCSPVCNSQPYTGISFYEKQSGVKDDTTETERYNIQINDRPAVKRDENPVFRKRKRKNRIKYQPLATEQLEHTEAQQSSTEINTTQWEETEKALQDFTMSDENSLGTDYFIDEGDTTVKDELPQEDEKPAITDIPTNDASIVSEKQPLNPKNVKYEWVYSPFIEHIDDYLSQDETDLSNYRNKREYIKVLEGFKCLIWTLIQMSNRPKIDPDTFFKVATAFACLTQSKTFSEVPANYPYYSLIIELKEKICAVAESQRISEFKLSPKRKAMLIAVRYQMGGHIKDLKFSELFR